jgi:hypothetical protein
MAHPPVVQVAELQLELRTTMPRQVPRVCGNSACLITTNETEFIEMA